MVGCKVPCQVMLQVMHDELWCAAAPSFRPDQV